MGERAKEGESEGRSRAGRERERERDRERQRGTERDREVQRGKDGGVRGIATGTSFCRLMARISHDSSATKWKQLAVHGRPFIVQTTHCWHVVEGFVYSVLLPHGASWMDASRGPSGLDPDYPRSPSSSVQWSSAH